MTVWLKQGVIPANTHRELRRAIGKVAQVYDDLEEDLYITSLGEGNHIPGSLHYDGKAFDFRAGSATSAAIKIKLGPGWEVISFELNGLYYHAEYDPA